MIKPLFVLILSLLFFTSAAQGDSQAFTALTTAYELQESGKRDSAIVFFIEAGAQFEKNGNWNKFVECLAGENRNYLFTDRIGDVEEKALRAIEIVNQGNAEEVTEYFVEILTQLSRVNWYAKGNYPEALKLLDRATGICDVANFDTQPYRLKLFTEYGYTYGYSGEFDLSETNFRKALELAIEVHGNESAVVADRYTDMVFPLIQKSEWEKAEVALKKAIELNIKIRGSEHSAVLKNYNNLGYIYLEKFDNEQAIIYINKAISMIRKQFGENHRSIGIGYMNLGASYSNKGETQEALKYSKMAIENLTTTIGPKTPYIGICLLNLGNEYNHAGQYDSAEAYYNKAIKFRTDLFGKEHHQVVNTYRYLTEFYLTTEDYEKAFAYSKEAVDIASKILPEKHKLSANSHLALSECYAATNQYQEALEEVQLALIGLMADFNDKDPNTNPDVSNEPVSTRILIEALIHKVKVLTAFYHETKDIHSLKMAYAAAEAAYNALDILRIEYQTPDSKEILLSRSKDFYEHAIEIAFTLYNIENDKLFLDRAFQYMEKSKSILLLENVRANNKLAVNSLPDSIAIEEKSLSRSIAFYREQLFEAKNQNDTARLATLEDAFFQKKLDYDLLLNLIEEKYPNYFSIQHTNFNTSIKSVQKDLSDQSLLVNYFYGKENIYVIAISSSGIFHTSITLDDQLNRSISQHVRAFEQKAFDHSTSFALFQKLLAPVLTHSIGQNITKITFIPDGILYYLPLETLVTSMNNNRPRYLIEEFTVNYMHSTGLANSGLNTSSAQTAYVGFSPSYNRTSNPLLASRSASDIQLASQLEKLPMAEKEIANSARIWNGKSMLNADATEENFKKMAANAGIIHIASHTIIDDNDPMNSKLVFSPGADTLEDGLLHTYELYNMELNAQLACLSACNTGFGQLKGGEGVVSLAKGFFYAGVPNVLMSLWSVPDNSTSEIMTTFYEELKKGEGKSDALRNAKLAYLASADENSSDPYYWAAFTMIGDNEPIETDTGVNLWGLALVLVIGIPALIIIVKKWA